MYRCDGCGSIFDEPESTYYCCEDYFGVSSLFPDRHYGCYDICPDCGSDDIEKVTYCDIYKCKDCPRMGDDCDGEFKEDDIDEF